MEAEALMMGLKLAENWTSVAIHTMIFNENYSRCEEPVGVPHFTGVVTYDCQNLMASFGRARMMHRGREADSHEHLVDFVLLTGLRGQGEPPSYFLVPVLVKDMIII
ncbi:hypothetical protein VPH35_022535 [Triticum aestivum]